MKMAHKVSVIATFEAKWRNEWPAEIHNGCAAVAMKFLKDASRS